MSVHVAGMQAVSADAKVDLFIEVATPKAESCPMMRRQHFRYLIAPDSWLLRSILSLSSSELAAAESALSVAADLAQQELSADLQTLQDDATLMEHALEAADAAVAVLGYAGEQLDSVAKTGLKRCLSPLLYRPITSTPEAWALFCNRLTQIHEWVWGVTQTVTVQAWLGDRVSQAEAHNCQKHLHDLTSSIACSVRASAAVSMLRARLAELSRKADLIQLLLGNSVPVNMQSLASEEQVISLFIPCYISICHLTASSHAMHFVHGRARLLTLMHFLSFEHF